MSLLWWPEPKAGDIVWCRFPHNKDTWPGSKFRPTLVVKIYKDHAPHFFVLTAYGTSQKTNKLYSGEFIIARNDGTAWTMAGLSYETKFSFRHTAELPFNSDWFAPPPGAPHGQNPKLGLLHPSLMRRAQAAWNAAKSDD